MARKNDTQTVSVAGQRLRLTNPDKTIYPSTGTTKAEVIAYYMEIAPYQEDGLKVRWTNVTLVDGRRDLPGVRRRHDEITLAPAPDRSFFLAGVGYDPFKDREEPNAIAGDPLRWSVVADQSLAIYSFMILEDGRYELQVSRRDPAPDGIKLDFERIVDGEVARRLTGRAVRAE